MKKFIILLLLLLNVTIYLQAQNVGIGLTNPLQSLDVKGKAAFRDSIGIGLINPHAPLQIANTVAHRKILLWEASVNDNNQFDGFGTDTDAQRYQVTTTALDHAFFAGVNADSSRELFRIKGSGMIGVGTSRPVSQFANTDSNTVGSDQYGINSKSINWAINNQGYVQGLYNRATGSGSNGLVIKIAGNTANNSILDLSTGDTQTGIGTVVMAVQGDGNVGIGTNSPHAQLQLSNNLSAIRKIILFETANNDNQFDGFGTTSDAMRYQVSATSIDHAFYAGSGAATSVELLRIKGTGRIGIGLPDPVSMLSNTNTNIIGSDGVGISSRSLTWVLSAQGYVASFFNPTTGFGHSGLAVKIAGNTSSERILDLSTGATQNTAGTTVMAVRGDGQVVMTGNLSVTGTISKGGGSFKIDHPLDPANKYLYHSFVESPDMMDIYNGNVITGNDGLITVDLPDYFEALNKEFRYQLTVIGDFAQAIIFKKINNNRFVIKTDKPNIEVSWQVTGIRHDPFAEKNRIPNTVDKPAEEKGYYLHPEARGLPASRSISAIHPNTLIEK